ncbi:MAG TPA: bifunctional UDP-N-acetylglucosamine diphosphorylase/glucosamine-1-phosphate N-acetyltransferase GlmU [Hyphomonadaceae bacterium]|jgi:bifunctional UDP-N-acetylglucosamine pyrophosphorylase/glucosamine-1-phosphate N-acetyltransferase|nr:bifunctional UDP-N-acetylglucosamine diphosphorylase/glucosamine-1-phosphate N-acetyltransferase GlmU [Hyphomonadaceae bacterium]
MADRFAVILAAGKGTRMKSPRPKVLHEIGGLPMLAWSVALAKELGCKRIVIVVGPDMPQLSEAAAKLVGAENVAIQKDQLGTANAVDAARAQLANADGHAIVLYADTPLVPKEAGERAFAELDKGASVCVLGFKAKLPNRYGRLVTAGDSSLEAIVEANDATEAQLKIELANSGVMAAPAKLMFELLKEVKNDNTKKEFYLTDLVGLARGRKLKAAVALCEERDVQGVNSQVELAQVEAVFQQQRRDHFMTEGVTLPAPETVYFAHDTKVAPGVTIEPNVVFAPGVSIETGAVIRAFSHLEGAKVGPGALIGPYARLRPGAVIAKDAHIGNFVEVKNVTVGEGAKANHLSYLGDGEVGAGANIGAGTIFCNYDGFFKYRTIVGAGAFIGSNSSLVAPVTIGAGGYTGSGSVIVEDVPADGLAIARGRQAVKEGWAKSFREEKAAAKKAGKKPPGAI